MNSSIIKLLNNPSLVGDEDKKLIEEQIEKYPYFFPLRLLLLNTIADKSCEDYEQYLVLASLHTPNRQLLKDFVFGLYSIQLSKEDLPIKEIVPDTEFTPTIELNSETLLVEQNGTTQTLEQNTNEDALNLKEASHKEQVHINENQDAEVVLINENTSKANIQSMYTFMEWLEMGETKKVFAQNTINTIHDYLKNIQENAQKNKVNELNSKSVPPISKNGTIVSETLAEIYFNQKNYTKAIETYQALMDIIPEKSILFANKIEEINKLC